MNTEVLPQRLDLGEDQDVEFKLAEGGLPKSLWETVSAFANTEGGTVVLGVAEKGEKHEIVGVRSPAKLIKAFWDGHNNPQKFSPALCTEGDVERVPIDGRELLLIRVRRAARAQRPVFVNGNPLTGTYKRNFEGDYRCTEAEVRQMLRDASDEPQDGAVLEGFGLEDLDAESLKAYRNRFASHEPDHPFLALDDRALLERLDGWRRERLGGRAGLTLAGLLMFGSERSLLDALPHYHLDYQEQLSADPEQRWTHRITVDGKWAPNLFNFCYRVYPRLVEGLDVPFKLDPQATRIAETHVHEALCEALVNTLIHADHQSSRPITVIKRQDAFVFFNPGRLRIPREALYQGGVSDPRNPNGVRLRQFVEAGWLEKSGHGRGTRYRWPRQRPGDLFAPAAPGGEGVQHSVTGSEQFTAGSEHLNGGSEHQESEQEARLVALAAPMRASGKVPKWQAEEIILALCSQQWLTLRTLARLLDRAPDSLRNHYINPMLRDGRLRARVPGKPNHPGQAYKKNE
jgi:ATP-dependent DNA helicase RecG